jgi:hypothetical protein
MAHVEVRQATSQDEKFYDCINATYILVGRDAQTYKVVAPQEDV